MARSEESGVSLWREVHDRLAREIRGGTYSPGQRLPPDTEMAKDYGVARQTMRRALSALRDQGVLRIEQGRGSFVTDTPFDFRLGGRIFLDQNLRAANVQGYRRILGVDRREASAHESHVLGIAVGGPTTSVRVATAVGGREIGVGENIFAQSGLPGVTEVCEDLLRSSQILSFTALLEEMGWRGLHRSTLRLSARPPTLLEEQILEIEQNEYVLETVSIILDGSKAPCYLSQMSYPSSRVRFYLDDDVSLG
ncbi:MAG: GntR family transcriptional regulator [Rhizobiaceae bacterium]|nr:GntR family transcriptional regulator [Rhizobiaceae bacterium]